MKRKYYTLLFCLITINLQAQCDSISAEVWDIIKLETYDRFDNFLMPIEQQRKILRWAKSDETDKMLWSLKDSLKNGLIASAKKLRLELLDNGFDLNQTEFNRCQLTGTTLDIFLSNNEMESNFTVETRTTDKIYVVLPINESVPELPTFQPTKEDLANSAIIVSGEKFKRFKPSDKEKKKGLEILRNCIRDKKIANQNILFRDGMKDKNGFSILTFMTVSQSDMNIYKVILENGTCENESK